MIKLDHLKIRVPHSYRGREVELVHAVASSLAEVPVKDSVRLDNLGPIQVSIQSDTSLLQSGRLIADGIARQATSPTKGGGND